MERRRAAPYAAGYAGPTLSRGEGGERGASLVELLTGTLFVSLLMAMSYSFARAALMSARVLEVSSEAQEATVMALDVMARELRMAGFSAAGEPLAGVRTADRMSVEVATDLNGDGDSGDANELVTYGYDEQQHQVTRATGGGSAQPLVRNVPPDGLQFSFFDTAGNEMAPASAEARRRIRRIDVVLLVELANPDPRATRSLTSTISMSLCLRNQ